MVEFIIQNSIAALEKCFHIYAFFFYKICQKFATKMFLTKEWQGSQQLFGQFKKAAVLAGWDSLIAMIIMIIIPTIISIFVHIIKQQEKHFVCLVSAPSR